jgi:hypothetical protein
MKTWTHPGGKLRELGAESLTDAELLYSSLFPQAQKANLLRKLHRKSLISSVLSKVWQISRLRNFLR